MFVVNDFVRPVSEICRAFPGKYVAVTDISYGLKNDCDGCIKSARVIYANDYYINSYYVVARLSVGQMQCFLSVGGLEYFSLLYQTVHYVQSKRMEEVYTVYNPLAVDLADLSNDYFVYDNLLENCVM